jgi:hypothetical protein
MYTVWLDGRYVDYTTLREAARKARSLARRVGFEWPDPTYYLWEGLGTSLGVYGPTGALVKRARRRRR